MIDFCGKCSYIASGLPAGLSINESTGVISGTIDYAAAETNGGSYSVSVTATDLATASDTKSFTWTVAAINQAPVIVVPDAQWTQKRTALTFSTAISVSDPDEGAAPLEVTLTVDHGKLTLGTKTGLSFSTGNGSKDATTTFTGTAAEINAALAGLYYKPASNYRGLDTLTITVNDLYTGSPQITTATADIYIGNLATPVWTAIPDQTSAEGDGITLQVVATDADGQPITYIAAGLPAGLTISASGLISGTISYDAAQTNGGIYTVRVTATDIAGASVMATFAWTVTNTNRAPVLDAIADQFNAEGDAIVLDISPYSSDPDADALTYIASGLPDGLSINASTGVISGTIAAWASTAGDNGIDGLYATTVSVADGIFTVSRQIVWTVNQRIVIQAVPDGTHFEGDSINLQLFAATPDNTSLVYSVSNLPTGLSVDRHTGLISGNIAVGAAISGDNQDAYYTATILATDGIYVGSATMNWTVNPLISISAIADQTNIEGDAVSLQVQATTPDNTTLSYSATDLPSGLSIDPTTGLISGAIVAGTSTGGDDLHGYYPTTIRVADGTYTAAFEIAWYVNPRIAIQAIAQQTNIEADAVDLQVFAGTPDNTALSYSSSNLPAGLSIDAATGLISGTIAAGASTAGDVARLEERIPGNAVDAIVVETVDDGADPLRRTVHASADRAIGKAPRATTGQCGRGGS